MSTSTNPHALKHLTEEQFTECLLESETPAECREHLALCEQCHEELAVIQSSVGSFNSASLAWTESRPTPSLRAAAGFTRAATMLVPAGWALAAASLLVVGLPALHRQPAPARAYTQVASTPAAEDSDAEIAQDNHLLESVDLALAQVDRSPLSDYNLTEAGSPRPSSQPLSRTR